MSFRELRSFSETMRLLGYPHLIGMESFRTPNVELVADCLYWLIKRYEPSAEVVYNIERESDRVLFFRQICEVALAKGRIKMNIKKLYQSDGHAVQEMLKLANALKRAMRATEKEEQDFAGLQQMAAQRNVEDAKTVQQVCSDLTADGSKLFFMVEEEMNNRGERQRVLSRATEVGEFERRLRELLSSVAAQVEQLQQSITNLNADETNLEQKIENKKTQLERAKKRYKSLMTVRPAFVEEYDKHEAELHVQFVKYLEQYRNLEYLEHLLAGYNAAEDAMLEEQETKLRVMRERLRREELKVLRSESGRNSGRRQAPSLSMNGDVDGAAAAAAANVHIRNAAVEGSSVDSSEEEEDEEDETTDGRNANGNGAAMRPQNALGRSRPSPSAELDRRRRGSQPGAHGGELDHRGAAPAYGNTNASSSSNHHSHHTTHSASRHGTNGTGAGRPPAPTNNSTNGVGSYHGSPHAAPGAHSEEMSDDDETSEEFHTSTSDSSMTDDDTSDTTSDSDDDDYSDESGSDDSTL